MVQTLGEKDTWPEQDTAGTGDQKAVETDTCVATSSVVLQPVAPASSGSV